MRRLSIVFSLLLALSLPGYGWAAQTAAWAVNASATPFSASASASVTVSLAAGATACVIFGAEVSNKTVSSVVDDGSNTYTLAATNEIGGSIELWTYCTVAGSSATSITPTLSSTFAGNGLVGAWVVTESRATSSVGNTNTAITTPAATAHTTGSAALTDASAMMLAVSYCIANCVYTNEAGWTEDGNTTRFVAASKAATGTEAYDPTTGGNEFSLNHIIEIRPAAAGAAGQAPGSLGLLGMGR